MENWLSDKTILHSLLHQGDYANTINGGITETYFSTQQQEDKVVLEVQAPGVKNMDFKIALNKNHLVVSRHLNELHGDRVVERVLTPSFVKAIQLPENIEREKIEAYYEDGVLRIILPVQDRMNLNREIKIRKV